MFFLLQEGKYVRKVRAQDLWFAILDAQMETGNPYMMYKVRYGSRAFEAGSCREICMK